MPLIGTAGLKNFPLMVEDDPFYFRLNVKICRQVGQSIDNPFEHLLADSCRFGGACVFPWKIGASIIFAMSVAYIDERASSGSVVKPIWLFTTMCTVPPVL